MVLVRAFGMGGEIIRAMKFLMMRVLVYFECVVMVFLVELLDCLRILLTYVKIERVYDNAL